MTLILGDRDLALSDLSTEMAADFKESFSIVPAPGVNGCIVLRPPGCEEEAFPVHWRVSDGRFTVFLAEAPGTTTALVFSESAEGVDGFSDHRGAVNRIGGNLLHGKRAGSGDLARCKRELTAHPRHRHAPRRCGTR
jgi:hypothetical protein